MYDAEPVFVSEGDDQFGERLVGYAAAELSIQRIDRGLAQGVAVDVVDCVMERRGVEQGALDAFGVTLESFIRAEAGSGRAAELAAHLLFLAGDVFGRLADQFVMRLVTRQGRRVGRACRGPQNLELAFGHALAVSVHPGQGVVSLCRAHVDQDALRPLRRRRIGA